MLQVKMFSGVDPKEIQKEINAFLNTTGKDLEIRQIAQSQSYVGSPGENHTYFTISILYRSN